MNISVVIPYHKNKLGLISNLINLQNQTVLPHKIVVIDTSPDKSGLEIAKTCAYHEVDIVVEVSPATQIYTAWNKGISLCDSQDHILLINDDVVLPINFISIMRYAAEQNHALVYVPETVERAHQSDIIDMNFKHQSEGQITCADSEWMPGFVFMLSPKAIDKVGLFDDVKYTIWFGDTDYEKRALLWGKQNQQPAIKQVKGTFVYHYGGKSYSYDQDTTLKHIDKDRGSFETAGTPIKSQDAIKSYVCKFCGEAFEKPILLGIHARKTGHKKEKKHGKKHKKG